MGRGFEPGGDVALEMKKNSGRGDSPKIKELEEKLLNATNQNSDKIITERARTVDVQNQFALATRSIEENSEEQIEPPVLTLADKLSTNR